MREIKFRAWDKTGKRMVRVTNLKWYGDYKDIINKGPCEVECLGDGIEDLVDYEIMQSTGLKDKNGKEIYEGDILATSNDGKDGADSWERIIIGSVFWNDKFACWNHRIDLQDEESIYSPQYVEVIGNIYENPEPLVASGGKKWQNI